jgi:hypothetical protein
MAATPATTAQPHSSQQAYQILHLGFTVLPVLAGLDKFFEVLADWDRYLAPLFPQMLGVSSATFMSIVGIIEIVAGLVVFFKPRLGGYLVMLWLWGIILNLLLIPGYYDIALRDFGLSLGALSLARLAVGSEATARVSARMREARV